VSRTFYTETVTRQRATTTTNARNDSELTWTNPSTLEITGCRLQPLSSDEVIENRWESDVRFRLLAPSGSDISYLDRIVANAVTYEVWGAPLTHKSPTGVAAHDEILLRRVTG
jgi:hypothetical protein